MLLRYSLLLLLLILACAKTALTQATNIRLTNADAEAIVLGNFNPDSYPGGLDIEPTIELAGLVLAELSADSLHAYLSEMNVFGNRNTGSDTVSSSFGIGAARRWALQRMEGFSARSGGRLQTGYLEFDQDVCSMSRHRNVIGILPGVGSRADELVLVEAHLDSRCADVCDIDCAADGMEDNASGSALVLELARVMSQYRFDRSIAFMLTTGEEQGLVGAEAFADYCQQQGVKLYAVLNNDIVGGVICGETASPPGCPGLNDIDSINVRLYSAAGDSKNLARWTKREYETRVAPLQPLPSVINLMAAEDRGGRGGDHIPFRINGYPAIRFTSANEHGNANASDPDYHDRQHTSEDVLGVDTNADGELDSFFVNFRYLRRNAIINAEALGLLAEAPHPPQTISLDAIDHRVAIDITDSLGRDSFEVAIRDVNEIEWDTIIRLAARDTVDFLGASRWVFAAAWTDEKGLSSLFREGPSVRVRESSGTEESSGEEQAVELLQNVPNPFDEATWLRVYVNRPLPASRGELLVGDAQGRELVRLPVDLSPGLHEVLYDYRYHDFNPGTYTYSLIIDGKVVATKWMVYAY